MRDSTFIQDYLTNTDDEKLAEHVFWIDWREDNADIVHYSEKRLNTGKLTYEYVVDNERGVEFYIIYGDKKSLVVMDADDSCDPTIIALNEILQPDYEIRMWMESRGSDTLGFVFLTPAEWSTLEQQFGLENVQEYFMSITPDTKIFRLTYDDVEHLL
ncbi:MULTISPECIES: hypothetical protein [unclassified Lysinibacillus]|uniref:hypothetical protein n=1 Tax=unclassified Lysinibacillus TaxID=2636778 RepID=UPI0025530D24|nr:MULTISPECIES: hypothetical protein [unclassified Lysinibacillus]MDM5248858.1 hypothetical protein [Lysinibacillus sp. G4S2]